VNVFSAAAVSKGARDGPASSLNLGDEHKMLDAPTATAAHSAR
jgi:hypothetical protein